jgi:hypothetical protein
MGADPGLCASTLFQRSVAVKRLFRRENFHSFAFAQVDARGPLC